MDKINVKLSALRTQLTTITICVNFSNLHLFLT